MERGVKPKSKKSPPRGNQDRSKPRPPVRKPPVGMQTTTLWDYPSQHYGEGMQGDKSYVGATPSYVIWNLLQRFTKEGDLVVDPMCGSGTSLDVAKDTGRQGRGFDIAPFRDDIQQSDARNLPLKSNSVDFVFVDPPYSTHVAYSGHAKCIGELDAREPAYYEAMEAVIAEIARVLKPGCYMALYVSDSFKKGRPFCPIGFELFARLCRHFDPIDIVAVTRHNKSLKRNHWHTSAVDGNYFLRGFNYLFIMQKSGSSAEAPANAEAGSLSAPLEPGSYVSPKALQKKVAQPPASKAKKKKRRLRL